MNIKGTDCSSSDSYIKMRRKCCEKCNEIFNVVIEAKKWNFKI